MISRNAIVFGASGLVGSYLKDVLLEKRYNHIQIWTRHLLPYQSELVDQIIWDPNAQNDDTLVDHLFNNMLQGDVYITLGTTQSKAGSKEKFERVDYHLPKIILKAAERKACPSVAIVSSIGANTVSKNFYLRTKGRVELLALESGIPRVLVLRPSLLLGPRKEFRLGERIAQIIMTALSPLMLGTLRKYRPIHAQKVAYLLVDKLCSLPADVKEIREIE